MLEGKLVDDQEMIRIMGKMFESVDPKQPMVLDGFPRTLVQANWLIDRAKAGDFDLTAVFYFEIAQAKVRDRLINRGRADDTEAAIDQRFSAYNSIIQPIIKRFENQGFKVVKIDANADPQTIHEAIIKTVNLSADKTK
jgi:adenylate kinase